MVKPPLRTKTVGTKLSEAEFAQLEAAARERGLTLSEWCRRVLLSSGRRPGAGMAIESLLQPFALGGWVFSGQMVFLRDFCCNMPRYFFRRRLAARQLR